MYLIIAANSFRYRKQEIAQKKTFAQDTDYDIFRWIYSGAREIHEDSERQIHCPGVEEEANILSKTIDSISWGIKKYNPDFIVRSNLSSYINITELRDHISTIEEADFIFGTMGKFIEKNLEVEFVSGSMMVMPIQTAKKIVHLKPDKKFNDDVEIGIWAREKSVALISAARCDVSYGHNIHNTIQYRLKHYFGIIVYGRMLLINKYLKSKKNKKALLLIIYACELIFVSIDPLLPLKFKVEALASNYKNIRNVINSSYF